MSCGKSYGWAVKVTVSPTEVWAHPGESVTVRGTASIPTDGSIPISETWDGVETHWDGKILWRGQLVITNGGSTDLGTQTVVLPVGTSNYDTSVGFYSGILVTYVRSDGTYSHDRQDIVSGYCLIHVVGPPNPTPDPTPTPDPSPTPVPSPIPTPAPYPTAVPTPVPTVTPAPTNTPAPTPAPTITPIPTTTPHPTATPSPTPTATPTPTPPPSLTFSSDKSQIVAGGWDDTRKAYEYLEKESDQWKKRDQKPDPHIATVTATLKDDKGNALSGKMVTFKWDMPGSAPEETRTAITDSDGVAKVDVVSGDTLSKAFDEKDGHLLYDEPVKVEATYGDLTQSKNLDVLAAQAQWQYKDAQGEYQNWDGSLQDLFGSANDKGDAQLRVVLTFGNSQEPVIGHGVSWDFEKVFYKWGERVPKNKYTGFGHLSGNYSTTTKEGWATASYSFSYRFGRINFAMDDASVHLKSVSPTAPIQSGETEFAAGSSGPPSVQKGLQRYLKKGQPVGVYTWIKGHAFSSNFAYPAPSGEENDELLEESEETTRLSLLLAGLRPSQTGRREGNAQDGDWWISQAIGKDYDSQGTHQADMKMPKGRLYGAAWDIVLTKVPVAKVYPGNKPRPEFFNPVQQLRDSGFVCWHRWAGEFNPAINKVNSVENEIHCIDPAAPFIKPYLQDQIRGYKKGLPNKVGANGYIMDWPLVVPMRGSGGVNQKQAPDRRARDFRTSIVTTHSGIKAAPDSPGATPYVPSSR